MIATYDPILRPLGLQLQREELREKNAQNWRQHQANRAVAVVRGDLGGVAVADAGIERCRLIAQVLGRRDA